VAYGNDPVTGKLRRKTWTFQAHGRRAAERQAARFIDSYEQDGIVGTRATVEQLLEEFMRFSVSRGRSPTTLAEYRRIVDVVLIPAIGRYPLEELTPHHLDTFYANAMRGPKAVSASSVRRYHSLISAALSQSVKWGWIDRNPAARATPPSAPIERVEVPSAEQVQILIEACQASSEHLGMFALLAAVTGCRRGELAALRWEDINGDLITIRASAFSIGGEHGIKATKTGRERAIVAGPEMLAVLADWRRRQESIADEWGVRLDKSSFVLSPRPDGGLPANVHTISSAIRKVADSAGLPGIHLHSLRHFAATELLGTGVSARDAADRLGHADPAMTLRVYAHATPERQRRAADTGDQVVVGLKRARHESMGGKTYSV
jgi:integrase